jgi:hypothetical protein
MSSNFNCSYMARSSLTIIPGFSVKHPVVLEKKFVLHISHRVAMLTMFIEDLP